MSARTRRTPRAPRLDLNVTKEVIEASKARDSSHCMLAETVRAANPDATHISVDLQTIRFSDPKRGLRYTYLTPRLAQLALIDFDTGELPEPFPVRLRNGQVTRSGQGGPKKKPPTEAQKNQRKAAAEAGREALKNAAIHSRGHGDGKVPDRVGGRTPPVSSFARIRSFGLRGLRR